MIRSGSRRALCAPSLLQTLPRAAHYRRNDVDASLAKAYSLGCQMPTRDDFLDSDNGYQVRLVGVGEFKLDMPSSLGIGYLVSVLLSIRSYAVAS